MSRARPRLPRAALARPRAAKRRAGALLGVRVIDFSQYAPGAFAAMLLADMGARVIRIDRIGTVDPKGEDGFSRGKRALPLNLKSQGGVRVARRLIETADVLIEGFRPGVMERLGLGPRQALKLNPRLIYARVTGWGQQGPLAAKAGHDINYLALAGTLSLIGRQNERPVPPPALIGDLSAGGLTAALGIIAALYARESTGRGQIVDAAIIDGLANLNSYFLAERAKGLWGPRGTNDIDTGAPFYDVYRTSDGRWLAVGALEPQFYAELLAGLGLPAATLPNRNDRGQWSRLRERFEQMFRERTLDQWCKIFAERDACVTPVLELGEVADNPHNRARGLVRRGPRDSPRPTAAPRFSATPASAVKAEPKSGADTHRVLEEFGFSKREVAALIADGAVGARRHAR